MPTIYKSADASAPVLTGQVGALTAVLKACLVSGYGSQTAAGWTNPYTGTNQEVFLQGGSGIKKYFQIDDNGPGAGAAKEARMWGFETMSAYNTGTGQFPAAGTNPCMRKSATADATVRDWIVAADAKTCHMWMLNGDVAATWSSFSFGDLYSFRPADQWKGYVCGRTTENSASGSGIEVLIQFLPNSLSAGNQAGMSGQRSYTGFGGPCALWNAGGNGVLSTMGLSGNAAATTATRGGMTFPNGAGGTLQLTPLRINQGTTLLRGRFRGLYCGEHPVASFNDQDIFSGINEYAGKTFLIIKSTYIVQAAGYWIVETSSWAESS